MTWIIASIPFWLLGLLALATAARSLAAWNRDRDPGHLALIAAPCLLVAGLLLVIAAKVAS